MVVVVRGLWVLVSGGIWRLEGCMVFEAWRRWGSSGLRGGRFGTGK